MMAQAPAGPAGGVGFDVAGGDPGGLSAAAQIHSDAADMLEMHAAVVAGAASDLDGAWQGQAASSYRQLSQVVHTRFNLAASGARTAAAGLREWADELDRCQRAGRTAMHECEYWLKQQQHWFFQLQDAERALTAAQHQLTTASAPNPFTGVTPPMPAPGASPMANPFTNFSTDAIALARQAVQDAEHAIIVAKGKLKEATEQVLAWQAKGRRAWQDATDAAERATGLINGIQVTPPPLAGFSRTEPTVTPSEPWYDHVLNIAGEVVGGAAAIAGVATALTFWIPGVGEVAAGTAGVAGVTVSAIDWAKVAVGDPGASVTESAVDTVLAVPGAADLRGIDEIPKGLGALSSKGLTGALSESPVSVGKVVSGTLDGTGGAYSAGTTAKATLEHPDPIDPHGDPSRSAGQLAGALSAAGR